MISLFINNSDRTGDLTLGTLMKNSQNQQRADSVNFVIFQGSKPTENQPVRLFIGDTISSIVGNTVVLNGNFEQKTSKFYTGQKLFLAYGTARETTAIVRSYNEATLTIVLTSSPAGILSSDTIGELIFGGVTSRVSSVNIEVLQNIEYECECVSYDKIFDRKLIADSWFGVDGRYIINSFVNSTINYNSTIDAMSYLNAGLIQAAWTNSGDGSAATVSLVDYIESSGSGVLAWTFSSGTATWSSTFSAKNLVSWAGVNSGTPTAGQLMFWVKTVDYTKVTGVKLRIGSDSSNYVETSLSLPTTNDWNYLLANLVSGTVTGTPNWTAVTYAAIIVTETASSSMEVNGFRLNASGSFTCVKLASTPTFTSYSLNNVKPTNAMDSLAKYAQYVWDIDYERDIRFNPPGSYNAPFNLTTTSNNFVDLNIDVDQSQVGNRIIVNGGLVNSTSTYAQVFQGDNQKREWILYTKYANLSIKLNDGTGTHSALVGTNTTNIKIAAHGLSTGDHVVNVTRSNAVRSIVVVDVDNFTVQTVTGQTTGDNITFFNITKTIGVDGLDNEASFDFMGNYQNQSIRNSNQTVTLPTTSFIRLSFVEKIPIQFQYADSTSIGKLKALGLGDGIFDLQPISDNSLSDLNTAISLAQANVSQYKNPIIKGQFSTDQDGLKVGQTIQITDTYRGFDSAVMIQTITATQAEGQNKDYFNYIVHFGTTLFGITEFWQKLIKSIGTITSSGNSIVEVFVTDSPTVNSTHVETVTKNGGFKKATSSSNINLTKTETVYKAGTSWHWETSTGQTLPTRWSLFSWS